MNVTKRLQELDPSLHRFNEGDWSTPFDYDRGGFSSFNDAGIECETGEFLYSLVRLLKPDHVLETGTHWGIGASYMGLALQDNKRGHLDTIEFLPEIHARAKERINTIGLNEVVSLHLMDARAFVPPEDWRGSNESVQLIEGAKQPHIKYGLILLDTEPQTRFFELIKFFPYLEEGGFVFIHDLHRHMHQLPALETQADHPGEKYWPYGEIPQEIKDLVNNDKLRPIHFSTPRGLTGFYKPSKDDYKWRDK